jgi:hypothetical protein
MYKYKNTRKQITALEQSLPPSFILSEDGLHRLVATDRNVDVGAWLYFRLWQENKKKKRSTSHFS